MFHYANLNMSLVSITKKKTVENTDFEGAINNEQSRKKTTTHGTRFEMKKNKAKTQHNMC